MKRVDLDMQQTASVATCSLFVQGMEMHCPLCKVLVKSGEHHTCQLPEAKPTKKRSA